MELPIVFCWQTPAALLSLDRVFYDGEVQANVGCARWSLGEILLPNCPGCWCRCRWWLNDLREEIFSPRLRISSLIDSIGHVLMESASHILFRVKRSFPRKTLFCPQTRRRLDGIANPTVGT